MATAASDIREIIRLVPGYDPLATAGDCWFDEEAAQRAIDFFPECLRHVEGALAGQPFILELWQQAFVGNLFGWKRLDEHGRTVRRYRESLLYVPRKNGKTPLVAGIALYVFFCDDELGQQNYIAAGEREQAGMLFRQCRGMVDAEPEMSERCQIYGGNAAAGQSKSLVREDVGSFLRVISADAHGKHGGNTHCAIVDELHEQKNRDLVDVLQTSMASANRKQPLLLFLTTADHDRPSICNEKHGYACRVRDGIISDPSFLPVIYETANDADWTSETTWRKANPNLGVSVSLEYLRRECKKAQENPAYENTFRRLHLNQKTEQAERVIVMGQWDACCNSVDRALLAGRSFYAGLDIGATSDFTAFVMVFPHDDGKQVEVPVDWDDPDGPKRTIIRRNFTVLPHFWLPEMPPRRDPRMQSVIEGWRKEGLIRTTSGNVVDYDQVLDDIATIIEPYSLEKIGVDRGFQGSQMCNNLMKAYGDRVKDQPQGILSMNAPFREFLELIIGKRIFHDGNPVLRWMASNTAAETKGGLIKPSKDKSTEKIDGIVALVMALGLAIAEPPAPKLDYYDTHEVEFG